MAFIPEETIDRIAVDVDDLKDTARIQTRAIDILSERINLLSEVLMKVHAAVTQPADGDGLGDLLRALVAADHHHAETLQTVLAEVRKGK